LFNLYLTADQIGTSTGGGAVTYNELQALKELGETDVLSEEQLNPPKYGLPNTPFLCDYLALSKLDVERVPQICHIYSGTFSQTVRWLKDRESCHCYVTYTCPAHDRKETIEEHKRMGYNYEQLYPHIADERLYKIFSEGLRLADIVIAPSKVSAEYLKAIGCQIVTAIPHGCNMPEKTPKLLEQFNIGYLGAWGPDKGNIYLLRAWEKLNYPDSHCVMAGIDKKLISDLLVRSVGHGKYQALGFVKDISEFFSQVSVYIQPSVCEGFGIPVLESMAFSRPVICSDGAGASDLITDGVEGFVVKKRDPAAIAERIDWFKHHSEKIPEMGKKARETAEKYTWEKIRKRYIELWTSKKPN